MASIPITSWQIDGWKMKTMTDLASRSHCGQWLQPWNWKTLLGRKAMIYLDSVFKSRDITLLTQVCIVKAVVFLIVVYGLELWCWRRLLRVPWTAGRSNQSILKERNSEYSLVGLTLKLKVKYFGHRMQRADSLEKILMLGKMRAKGERGSRGCYCCIASLTHWIWIWANIGG